MVHIADPIENICYNLYILSINYEPVNKVAQLQVEPCKDELHNLSMGQTDLPTIQVKIVLGPFTKLNGIIKTEAMNNTSVSQCG